MTDPKDRTKPSGKGTELPPIRCPIHDQSDCSPVLNGCWLVNALHRMERATVDEAIEAVRDTYKPEGQRIVWHDWLTRTGDERKAERLQWMASLGGMVAT